MGKCLIHLALLTAGICSILAITACTPKKDAKPSVWIYTSLYKDTISDIQPKLEKVFPDVDFKFYQAGSEEVAAKVNAENLAGGIQADILISSDRFWYEEMAKNGKIVSYKPLGSEKVPDLYRNKDGFYTTLSFPVMVLAINTDLVSVVDAPKSFKELELPKWKGKIASGSPLASGTNFTTLAFLQKMYGWEYFKALRKNELVAEGGNSGVIRRLQNKEKAVGIVLLENVLRLTESDPRIKFVIPSDGAIIQSNVLAVVKKDRKNQEQLQKIADWFYGKDGQAAMSASFMYPAISEQGAPKGAPEFKDISKNSPAWTEAFVSEILAAREKLKDEFTKIIF